MDISKIEIGTVPNEVNVVIEIPFGSSIKYEVDKETGAVVVDRVMRSAVYYPANYGFIPHTLAGDDDPIDVLVLNEYELQAGSVICCRLIGVLLMEDEGGKDEKLLAVAVDSIDPTYKEELDAQYDAMKKYALKEARREAKAEGRTEGKSEEKNTIAVSMKKDGVNLDIIAKYTGLSIDKIAALVPC